jgi:hypothetical protein
LERKPRLTTGAEIVTEGDTTVGARETGETVAVGFGLERLIKKAQSSRGGGPSCSGIGEFFPIDKRISYGYRKTDRFDLPV